MPDGSWHWDVRVTGNEGGRTNPVCLPQKTTKFAARKLAKEWTEDLRQGRLVLALSPAKPGGAGETFAKWFDRWCADRETRGTPAKDQRGHFAKWIAGRLGPRPIASITKRDLEQWVEWIDARVRAGELSAKTAANTWGTLTKSLGDAFRSKTLALRALAEDPVRDVVGPDRGVTKSKAFLYPSELLAVISCARVPIRWRRLFALAVYTYSRPGELEALEWEDVDLEHGVIHIHRAIDRDEAGAVKETKTDSPRRIPIEPNLVPLLEGLKGAAPDGGRVVKFPPVCDLAKRLRQYVEWAGVKRAELTANDATRKQLRFYDLRASGLTWMAIRGDDAMKIMQRAGHKDIKTTMGYVRTAEVLGASIGDVFPPLPDELFSSGVSSEGPAAWGLLRESTYKSVASPAGFEPEKTRENPSKQGVLRQATSEPPTSIDGEMTSTDVPPTISTTIFDPVPDPVVGVLTRALEGAIKAGDWPTVEAIGAELKRRQPAPVEGEASNVVKLDPSRRRGR